MQAKQEMTVLNEKWLSLNEQAKALGAKIKSSSIPENDIEADRRALDVIYNEMDSLHKARVQIAREAGFYIRVQGNSIRIYENETDCTEEVINHLRSDGIKYL